MRPAIPKPDIRPLRRFPNSRRSDLRPTIVSINHNNKYNILAAFYNNQLAYHHTPRLVGLNVKFMRLVNPETGMVVDDRVNRTPATVQEILWMGMSGWDNLSRHYGFGWDESNSLMERRLRYAVFLGIGSDNDIF